MSDPVTHHDIEDVLSSIRRLVAQGDTRRPNDAGATPSLVRSEPKLAKPEAVTDEKKEVSSEAPADKPAPERLVLTPAFRITPQADKAPKAEPAANGNGAKSFDAAVRSAESDVIPTKDSRPMPTPERSSSQRASLEATIAELEAAVNSRSSDEWEPDGSEKPISQDFHSVFASKLEAFRPSRLMRRWDGDASETNKTDTDTADVDDVPTTESVLNDIVVDHIAEAVQEEIAESFPHMTAADEAPESADDIHAAALADVSEQLMAERASDTGDEAPFADDVAAQPVEENGKVVHLTTNAAHPATAEPAPVAEDDKTEAAAPAVDEAAETSLHAAVMNEAPQTEDPKTASSAAPEAETIEPEVVDAPTFRHAASFKEVYDPVAEATADAAEAEAAAEAEDIYGDELQEDPAAVGTAVTTPAPAGQLMDPDMLRDMVSQMIRQELQGEMGERITRNVRKLVRREINRVLSAQDFD